MQFSREEEITAELNMPEYGQQLLCPHTPLTAELARKLTNTTA
jgi:hypothetical protein